MRSGAWLPFLLAALLVGCGPDIVLGDSEAALPSAGAATAGAPPVASNGGSRSSGGSGQEPELEPAPPGDVVWSTDHEVGDFSDWERGGDYYGGEYEWGNVNGYVDIGVGRDGSNGVVADIDTASRSEPSAGVRLYRRIEAGPAYYSAWFRLEEAHTVSDWWSIFLFHARDDSLSLDNDVSLWDVRVVTTPSGELSLQFFDHDVMQGFLPQNGAGHIAPGLWFEIRAYLDYRPPSRTRLSFWLNGTRLFDMKDLHTAEQSNVFWSIGNGAGRLAPADSTLYLDDAAIHGAAP